MSAALLARKLKYWFEFSYLLSLVKHDFSVCIDVECVVSLLVSGLHRLSA